MKLAAVAVVALLLAKNGVQAQSDSPGNPLIVADIDEVLSVGSPQLRSEVFVYQAPDSQWYESDVFTLEGFVDGFHVMVEQGVAGQYFYVGENNYRYGIVNIAAFLAQVMKESLQYNACDENSWDLVNGRYPISNSCGQLEQSYQDYKCPAGQEDMECPVDPNMQITATTNAKWYGAPGPLYCGPTSVYPTTGYWDSTYECNKPWADPPEYCEDYEGQKAGVERTDQVVPNSNGRTDVEGCCWWGRGAIQTSGVCNYGRLNYFLGKRAADEGRNSRYPTVDLCQNPDAICSSQEFPELKWVAGLFYWMDSVQTYNEGGWDYLTELRNFVDGGMQGDSFINAVSGIVNRGCHNPPCATGPVDGGPERAQNFRKVLNALQHIPGAPFVAPVAAPTNPPAAPVAPTTVEAPVEAPVSTPMVQPVQAPVVPPTVPWNGVMCCEPGETSPKAVPGCQQFYQCVDGQVVPNSLTPCQAGLFFDSQIVACNWSVDCSGVVDCPTEASTTSLTVTPPVSLTTAPASGDGVASENGAAPNAQLEQKNGTVQEANVQNGGSSAPARRTVTGTAALVSLLAYFLA